MFNEDTQQTDPKHGLQGCREHQSNPIHPTHGAPDTSHTYAAPSIEHTPNTEKEAYSNTTSEQAPYRYPMS